MFLIPIYVTSLCEKGNHLAIIQGIGRSTTVMTGRMFIVVNHHPSLFDVRYEPVAVHREGNC